MTRTLVADLHARVGGTVTVYGWVDMFRLQRRTGWSIREGPFLFRGPHRLEP